MIDKKALQKHATLCWICDKAGGKCSWSNDFTPIDGWKAIPTKLSVGCGNFIDSFDVYECPEFEPFRRFTESTFGLYQIISSERKPHRRKRK